MGYRRKRHRKNLKKSKKQGTQFRIRATQRLKEYIIKGFRLNDDRFKSGSSMNWFNELRERGRQNIILPLQKRWINSTGRMNDPSRGKSCSL